jgi:hypothetical protein
MANRKSNRKFHPIGIAHLSEAPNRTYTHYGTHPPIERSTAALFIQIRNLRI